MTDVPDIKPDLEAWLRKKMPVAADLLISDLRKPGMGLSSETLLFDIQWKEKGKPRTMGVVLRSAPRARGVFPEYHLGDQFRLMKILREKTDVPVAEVLWLEEDPSVIGVPFFLMRALQGDVPQDFPSYHGSGMYFEAAPEMRRKMWWGTVDAIVKIHKLDWKALGLDFLGAPGPGTDPVDRQLAYWDRYLNRWIKDTPQESHPTMEATLEWLKKHRYAPERVTLCWGDARIGNTLYSRPDRDVLAIMDWEMAFIGDPECDLAWCFTLDKQASAGYGLQPLEGTPTAEEVIERYERLSGRKIKNLFYNEVMATFRFGLTVVASLKNLQSKGIAIPNDMLVNNFATQRLAKLLGLPAPGPEQYAEVKTSRETLTAAIQFHYLGPDGYDWYLLCEKGKVSRHPGRAENPKCTVKVSIADWKAILAGKLNQLDAWSSGKLVVDGDNGLLSLLKEDIARYSFV